MGDDLVATVTCGSLLRFKGVSAYMLRLSAVWPFVHDARGHLKLAGNAFGAGARLLHAKC